MSNAKETRSTSSYINVGDDLYVSGYAAVFDDYAVIPGNTYDYEVIDRHAFDHADFSRCVFRYNHSDHDQLLARVSNDTLKLSIDDHGLRVDATLADTTQGHDLYKLIKRRDINAMSFGFIPAKTYVQNRVRHIAEIRTVVDVAAVDDPAYPTTTLEVVQQRNAERAQKEALALDEKRKRLYLACIS